MPWTVIIGLLWLLLSTFICLMQFQYYGAMNVSKQKTCLGYRRESHKLVTGNPNISLCFWSHLTQNIMASKYFLYECRPYTFFTLSTFYKNPIFKYTFLPSTNFPQPCWGENPRIVIQGQIWSDYITIKPFEENYVCNLMHL